jgi:Spherulation-specific family 4
VAVPAYFPPQPEWRMMAAAIDAGLPIGLVVMNPASGPGASVDPAYLDAVAQARSRNVRVLGYIATDHGRRTSVPGDVDAYKRLYGVTDIFFDEATMDCRSLAAPYAGWITTVRANGGLVVANPGMVPEQCWADAVDTVVTFEGTYASYLGTLFPPWTRSYPAARFWQIVYGVPRGLGGQVAAIAAKTNAGYYYATDDILPNPYDTFAPDLAIGVPPPPPSAPPRSALPPSASGSAPPPPTVPTLSLATVAPPTTIGPISLGQSVTVSTP